MFLSRLLTDAEKNYWPTELEVSALCWTLRKVRHLVEACPGDLPAVVYTDHSSTVGIAKATSLSSVSLERQNLRLVRASQFIQQFRLRIFHKPGKTNKIADALSRLPSADPIAPKTQDDLEDIPAPYVFEQPTAYLLTASVLQLSDETRDRILQGYQSDNRWSALIETLQSVEGQQDEQVEKLPYHLDDGLAIFTNAEGEESLCLPRSMTQEILNLVHDEQMHQGFDRAWQKLRGITFYKGAKLLKQYIEHCPVCLEHRIRRHRPYGSLQPILTPPIPFHTITIDLIAAMPLSAEGYDAAMTMTDKFTKLMGMIAGRADWDGEDWALGTLSFWWTANWGILTVIISDRDPKFTRGLWKTIFDMIQTKLLFTTAYHPQTDGQSERTNQTAEIALRHAVATHPDEDWPNLLPALQAALNSSVSATTGHTPHKLLYGYELRHP